MKRKICLTGSSGFIGNQFLDYLLERDEEVIVVFRDRHSKDKLKPSQLDKINYVFHENKIDSLIEFFKKEKPTIVVHLASLFLSNHTKDDIDKLLESNVKLGAHLLEAMSLTGVKKIINTSTTWEHYNNKSYDPVNLYAATKKAFEVMLTYYINVNLTKAITLMIYDTFGENDPRKKLIPYLIKGAFGEEELDLTEGNQVVSLTDVKDICSAYFNCIENFDILMEPNINKSYYLDSGVHYSIREIVQQIELFFGKKMKVNWGVVPYAKRQVMNLYTGGEKLPYWKPKYSFKKFLKKQFDEYSKYNLNKQ